jgi:VanZ family protein
MLEKTDARTIFGALSLFVALGILFCTLWPFQPFPPNQVSWLQGSNGIRFDSAGVVLSAQPLQPASQSIPSGGSATASVEIWLKPSNTHSVSTVLDFYEPGNPFRFQLRQYLDGLIVSRDSRTSDGKMKRTKIDLDHGLQRDKLMLVTLTCSAEGTSLYLDGERKGTYSSFRFTPSDLSGQIVLGTSPVDSQPWTGEIRGLAVYADSLTLQVVQNHVQDGNAIGLPVSPEDLRSIAIYAFREHEGNTIHALDSNAPDLQIPAYFKVPHQAFLKTPSAAFQASWSYFADAVSNVIGFMPLGVCLCAYLASTRPLARAMVLTVIAGFIFSLGIEMTQVYLPQRVSDWTDVLTDTLGTGWGALVGGALKNHRLWGARGR